MLILITHPILSKTTGKSRNIHILIRNIKKESAKNGVLLPEHKPAKTKIPNFGFWFLRAYVLEAAIIARLDYLN